MITVRTSKSAFGRDGKILSVVGVALAIAKESARHVQWRARRGDFATVPKRYKNKEFWKNGAVKKFRVSKPYAQQAGVGGQTEWDSSAEFHRSVGKAQGDVSGGMWAGLQVRNWGSTGSIVEFARSSMASAPKRIKQPRVRKALTEAEKQQRAEARTAKPTKVQNRVKADAVFRALKIGLLQHKPQETQAITAAVSAVTGKQLASAFGGTLRIGGDTGNTALYRAIVESRA